MHQRPARAGRPQWLEEAWMPHMPARGTGGAHSMAPERPGAHQVAHRQVRKAGHSGRKPTEWLDMASA